MEKITMEQFKAIRDIMDAYLNYNFDFICQVPNELARIAAAAWLYESRDRAVKAMKMNIDHGLKLDGDDVSFMFDSATYIINRAEEKVETSPDCDRKALLDAVEEYKALLEVIDSLFPKVIW